MAPFLPKFKFYGSKIQNEYQITPAIYNLWFYYTIGKTEIGTSFV